ncbi:hypothetical protein [Streptomyces malaysiensis]|uniref:Uncharacterized protein n=1 Tax=Streptomyces malaysiensis subsp. samsunensis TaxID=459658 RepID=A0A9X2RXE5_STRMQ|nr:hypothetical protein [Streptomyces samsunensis]MCQ8831749.1 hypothetical protein [Streptomyces samsunensis]
MADLNYPFILINATLPNTAPQVVLSLNDGAEVDEAALAQAVKTYFESIPGATGVYSTKSSVVSNTI